MLRISFFMTSQYELVFVGEVPQKYIIFHLFNFNYLWPKFYPAIPFLELFSS